VRSTPKITFFEEDSLFEEETRRPAASASKENETKDEGQFEPMKIQLYVNTLSNPNKKSRSKSSRYFNLPVIKKPTGTTSPSKVPRQKHYALNYQKLEIHMFVMEENVSPIRFNLDAEYPGMPCLRVFSCIEKNTGILEFR